MTRRMMVAGIRGSSNLPGYIGSFEVWSVQFGARRSVLGPPDFPDRREALAAYVGEVVVVKDWGRGSIELLRWALEGGPRDVTIHCLFPSRGEYRPLASVALGGALLWSFSLCGSGGECSSTPMCFLGFSFQSLTYYAHQGGEFSCAVAGPQPADSGLEDQGGEEISASSTEDALVAALRQAPMDELTWSALADWLEEEGRAAAAGRIREARRPSKEGEPWWGVIERP